MTSPASRQWAVALLTATADDHPTRHELAREATQEGVEHLAQLAVASLRLNGECVGKGLCTVLADLGLCAARSET